MAITAGCMARAWASARPGERPRRSAVALTATTRSRLPRLPKTTRGEDATRPSRHCCAMRSVERRVSHRLSIRCELETLLHTVPLHDPCSGAATAIAHKTHCPARRPDSAASLRGGKRKRTCGADDPARCSGAVRIVWFRTQKKAERAAGCCGKRQPPHRHLIDAARGCLADHHAHGTAAQRLLHRPQHVARARGCDRNQLFGSDSGLL